MLNRKDYAKFLTDYLKIKTLGRDGTSRDPFTLAIDAQWGQGKTFFVSNWAKTLSDTGHPTILFDAWKADYASDPVVAFMAEFKSMLDERIKSSELTASVKNSASAMLTTAVQGLRRAILPAGKQIAKGLLHKATGIAADEIMEALGEGGKPAATSAGTTLVKDGLLVMNAGLDKFFDTALEEHGERKLAIEDFRKSVELTLGDLASSKDVALPMFVFIDELDRCRPNFAIALLEGVKHLFGIKGVCFVISTNMVQLSHSIKAVYGEGFDGRGYLKRFFDVESSLPEANGGDYMALLLKSYPEFNERSLSLGLPSGGFYNSSEEMNAAYVLAWVAEFFSVDLRAQRTLVEMIVASMAGIPTDKKVFLLWLAVLCVFKLKAPGSFDALVKISTDVPGSFMEAIREAKPDTSKTRSVRITTTRESSFRKISIAEVATEYHNIVWKDLYEIQELYFKNPERHIYPFSILQDVAGEMPNPYSSGVRYPTSLTSYVNLVRNAGYLSVG